MKWYILFADMIISLTSDVSKYILEGLHSEYCHECLLNCENEF